MEEEADDRYKQEADVKAMGKEDDLSSSIFNGIQRGGMCKLR